MYALTCFLFLRKKFATAFTSGSDSGMGPQYVSAQGCNDAPSPKNYKTLL